MIVVSGVRSSWLTIAKKLLLVRSASSAASFATRRRFACGGEQLRHLRFERSDLAPAGALQARAVHHAVDLPLRVEKRRHHDALHAHEALAPADPGRTDVHGPLTRERLGQNRVTERASLLFTANHVRHHPPRVAVLDEHDSAVQSDLLDQCLGGLLVERFAVAGLLHGDDRFEPLDDFFGPGGLAALHERRGDDRSSASGGLARRCRDGPQVVHRYRFRLAGVHVHHRLADGQTNGQEVFAVGARREDRVTVHRDRRFGAEVHHAHLAPGDFFHANVIARDERVLDDDAGGAGAGRSASDLQRPRVVRELLRFELVGDREREHVRSLRPTPQPPPCREGE
jgi:hypothetical protein